MKLHHLQTECAGLRRRIAETEMEPGLLEADPHLMTQAEHLSESIYSPSPKHEVQLALRWEDLTSLLYTSSLGCQALSLRPSIPKSSVSNESKWGVHSKNMSIPAPSFRVPL